MMTEKLKNWLLGLLAAFSIFGYVVAPLNRCSPAVPPANGKHVDTVLTVRHDTLIQMQEVLKVKVKYIDTSKITVVHDTLDAIIAPDSSDGNEVIASNQLREAVKWKDSLNTCIEMRKVDSVALDSIAKIAKRVDTIKACTLKEQAKSFRMGTLLGITIRSLF